MIACALYSPHEGVASVLAAIFGTIQVEDFYLFNQVTPNITLYQVKPSQNFMM